MFPLILASYVCFSDVTREKACEATTKANMQYYNTQQYTDYTKSQAELYLGKELVDTTATVGYMVYKKQVKYAIGSSVKYGVELTEHSKNATISWSW